ncbi:hypothetical protein L2E82_21047 [Cichorium intybus]|uniref:Uncharacterized protein n=1 Tax=Cichorium intybus TaxID=13427 RepID=A0ACB9DV27_CICIN|nr:hypothetical protein L2E82_21047 [Cichorium intybus]
MSTPYTRTGRSWEDDNTRMGEANCYRSVLGRNQTGPMDSDYEERGDKGHFGDKMNMGERNENKADDLEKEKLGEDDSYVEEPEVNNKDREDERGEAESTAEIVEQPEKNGEKNGSWDALLDDAATVDPKDKS